MTNRNEMIFMSKVMVFGTFDGLHDGHLHFFREAAEFAEELLVVVARDEHVLELKGKLPNRPLAERMEYVGYESEVSVVLEGDIELETYGVIHEHQPDLIVIGHDQDELRESIQTWCKEQAVDLRIMTASAYMPDVFKSSYLNAEQEEVGVL